MHGIEKFELMDLDTTCILSRVDYRSNPPCEKPQSWVVDESDIVFPSACLAGDLLLEFSGGKVLGVNRQRAPRTKT